MGIKPQQVAEVMQLFQVCDPYLNRTAPVSTPLLEACQQLWNEYGNTDPVQLEEYAAELKHYFK